MNYFLNVYIFFLAIFFVNKEEIIYQQTEVFFMVVKDVDSVMTCGAALAQMPKGEKYFANTVPCNTGHSNQSHCSNFLYCLSQTDYHD